jgi:hypothetical protein
MNALAKQRWIESLETEGQAWTALRAIISELPPDICREASDQLDLVENIYIKQKKAQIALLSELVAAKEIFQPAGPSAAN